MSNLEPNIEQQVAKFEAQCRNRGLKVTHQRVEIYRALAESSAHPDAETVFKQVRMSVRAISVDTVYRTLAWLTENGFAFPAGAGVGPTRYDANMQPHHHFVCRRCGRVQDFFCPSLDALPVPSVVGELGRVESAHVQVLGICAACAAKQSGENSASAVPDAD